MFESIRKKYGFCGAKDEFYSAWDGEHLNNFPQYLTDSYLEDINQRYIGLENEPFNALCNAAHLLRENGELLSFASYCRSLIFESSYSEDYLSFLGFPKPATEEHNLNDFFGLLVHLSGIDVVEKRYHERGIPLRYMKASYRSVYIWIHSFYDTFGRWGHNREFPRMLYIENLRIIRIGRLEFETNFFRGNVVVLQSRKDGNVALLSEGGIPINTDGFISGTNDIRDKHEWYTEYDETDAYYQGHPVINERVLSNLTRYSKNEWSLIARKGSNSLNIHIPRDGKLSFMDSSESIELAKKFYTKYFPDRKHSLFECHTWLFDLQIPKMLGENSGIVIFRNLFNIFPEALGEFGAMVSVFSEAPFDIFKWDAKTTLQRKIIELYKNGGRMFAAGGIIPFSQE